MFNLFKVRKPRRFHHDYLYVDERKERLREIEERARRELGLPLEDNNERISHE